MYIKSRYACPHCGKKTVRIRIPSRGLFSKVFNNKYAECLTCRRIILYYK